MNREKQYELRVIITEEENKRLDELCQALKTSRSGLVRRIINSPIIIDQIKNSSIYDDYLESIRLASHSFKDLVYTPIENKIVYRTDIVLMSETLNEMRDTAKEFVEEYLKEQKAVSARTKRQVDAGLRKLKEKG